MNKNIAMRLKTTSKSEDRTALNYRWYEFHPLVNALFAGAFAIPLYFVFKIIMVNDLVKILVYVLLILLSSFYWAKEAIANLIDKKEIGTGILVIAAVIGSIVLGLWSEAVFLSILYGVAEGLEDYTYMRTRHSIRSLLKLAPKEARIIMNNEEKIIPADSLELGEIFIVKPGESIPTDGIVVKGNAYINESSITGESKAVFKDRGDTVFAGTTNTNGVLEVKAKSLFKDNTISKIINLVEKAQESKGKTQLFIERFGRIYSPIVLATALILMIIPHILRIPHSVWNVRAISFLVAAAPCALIMSTPVTVAAGIGRAGKNGALIKGGIYLELLGKVKSVLFDKTGTLTIGEMTLTDVLPIGVKEKELLSIAYSIEKLSTHPIAQAIVKVIRNEEYRLLDVSDFREISGFGVEAVVGSNLIYIGKPKNELDKKFITNNTNFPLPDSKTIAIVKKNEGIIGIFGLADVIRPNTKLIISGLYNRNLHIAMLTGDNRGSAEKIALELGIQDIRANLKPSDKLKIVEDFKKENGPVVMIGDGVNDAPALATADVGIAMGVIGTDVAIEAADVAFMSDDFKNILFILDLGKKVRQINTQNIILSIFVLSVLIPLTLFGIINIPFAVVFHELSELFAVSNGVRAGLGT